VSPEGASAKTAPPGSAGRVVTLIGAKGGVGTTAVAANLAAALARKKDTLLVSLPGAGDDLALWFAASAPPGAPPLSDLRKNLATMNPELLDSATQPVGGKLRLLCLEGGVWTREEAQKLLSLARVRHPFVVVDAGAWRGTITEGQVTGAVSESASAYFVFTPDPMSVRRTRELVAELKRCGRPLAGVANRFEGGSRIGPKELSEAMDRLPVVCAIPDSQDIPEAMLRGAPVSFQDNRSPLVAELLRLAGAVEVLAVVDTGAAPGVVDEASYHTPAFRAMKRKLHRTFLDRMREGTFTSSDPEQVKAQFSELLKEGGMRDMTGGFRERLLKELVDGVLGLGSLEDLLNDPAVTEVMVNSPEEIYVEKAGKLSKVPSTLDGEEELRGIIERIVAPLGRRIDESSPLVDARLPDGSRVNAVIPPLALKGSCLTIRKFAKKKLVAEDLVRNGSLTEQSVKFLKACVAGRMNILISGGTGSGKTTLLNILASFIGSDERIVTIEDAAELKLPQDHVVILESRPANLEGKGAITIRDLVKNCLRMRPDRIVVGECRGGEALDMLQAMNTGHDGSLSTLHANTPRDALSRLETMILMAGMDLPLRAIREQVSSAVNLIVQIARQSDGGRRVTQVTEIAGMEGDVYRLQDVFERKGLGELEYCKMVPRLAEVLEERGQKIDFGGME
jgi:pilus assembly protein CpaF